MTTAGAVVTGTGAVTSVGRTARAACSAIRAGIARPSATSEFRVVDPDTQDLVPLVGHPLKGYTDGFNLLGRWTRLARGALADLRTHAELPDESDRSFWSTTGLVAVTPYADDEIFLSEEPGEALGMIRDGFLSLLQAVLPIPAERLGLVTIGHAGTAVAVERVLHDLEGRRFERVIVLAVDSCFDALALQSHLSRGRVKCGDRPAGFMPGESSACVLIERADAARRRDARVLASVCGAAVGKESPDGDGLRATTGAALAACVTMLLAGSNGSGRLEGDVVSDLNGEIWRATEWGSAVVRLAGRVGDLKQHLPAVSVGETGAASGALGACLGVHLISRGVAKTGTVYVLSSSDQGEVGCMALGQPNV